MLHDNVDKIMRDPESARELFISCPEVAADLIMHAGLGRGKKAVQTTKPVVPAKRFADETQS